MDFTIPEEYRQLQLLARKFVDDELRPLERELDENDDLPAAEWKRLRQKSKDIGLYWAFVPEKYGGAGIKSMIARNLVTEEFATSNIAWILAGHFVGMGGEGGAAEYTPYQLEKYIIPTVKGEKFSCAAMTEPGGGSDQRGMRTTAVKRGNKWIINGSKAFITGADKADYLNVYAAIDTERKEVYTGTRQVGMFLVDKNAKGFTLGRRQPMMGVRGTHQHELYFDDCEVPAENEINVAGRGVRNFQVGIQGGRLGMGFWGIGTAKYANELSIRYAKERKTFGQPLATRQAIQWMIIDTAMETETTRWFSLHTSWQLDQGVDQRPECSMAKILGSELGCRAADRAIQIHGGAGYTRDLPFERMYRDMRLARIGEGGNEINRYIIGRYLLGLEGFGVGQ